MLDNSVPDVHNDEPGNSANTINPLWNESAGKVSIFNLSLLGPDETPAYRIVCQPDTWQTRNTSLVFSTQIIHTFQLSSTSYGIIFISYSKIVPAYQENTYHMWIYWIYNRNWQTIQFDIIIIIIMVTRVPKQPGQRLEDGVIKMCRVGEVERWRYW